MNQRGIMKQNMGLRNGWVLCSSKTFPGKCYYFNVHTGEAAWNSNDIEKARYMSQNMVPPEPSKYYPYAEPSSPPMYMPYHPYFGMGFQNHMTPPQFGSTSFRNYLPPDFPTMQPNIKAWNHHMPEFMPNSYMKKFEESDSKVMVQATTTPLNKRFLNNRFPFKIKVPDSNPQLNDEGHCVASKKPRLQDNIGKVQIIRKPDFHQKPNESDMGSVFHKFSHPLPRIDNENDAVNEISQAQTKMQTAINHVCQCPINHTSSEDQNQSKIAFNQANKNTFNQESEIEFNHTNNHQTIEMDFSPETNHNSNQESNHVINKSYITKEKTDGLPKPSIFSPTKDSEDTLILQTRTENENNTVQLPKSDLRLMLLAKRKRCETTQGKEEIQKQPQDATNINKEKQSSVKKQVSFCLDNLHDDMDLDLGLGYQMDDFNEQFPEYSSDMNKKHQNDTIMSNTVKKDIYFVVSDTQMLMDHWTVLAALLDSGKNHKLFLPEKVTLELKEISLGDCRGRQNVMKGRQVTRLIALTGSKIVKEDTGDKSRQTSEDPIIECCLKIFDRGDHLILITNDRECEVKASNNYITYLNIEEIKQHLLNENQPVTFDGQESDVSPILESRKRRCYETRSQSPILECKSPKIIQKTLSFAPLKVAVSDSCQIDTIDTGNEGLTENLNNELMPEKKSTGNSENTFDELLKNMSQKVPKKFVPINQIKNPKDLDIGKYKIPKLRDRVNKNKQGKDTKVSTDVAVKQHSQLSENCTNVNKPKTDANVKQCSRGGENWEVSKRVEDEMEKFSVNEISKERLNLRKEEWICTFRQIMEDALSEILVLKKTSVPSPPWDLCDATECIKSIFSFDPKVKYLAEHLAYLLFKFEYKGSIKSEIDNEELMTILVYGTLLVEAMMGIMENTETLKELDCGLKELLKNIEDPSTDPDMKAFNLIVRTPVDFEDIIMERKKERNFADVKEFLKKHFPHLREQYAEENEGKKENNERKPREIKIVRTLGKNIEQIKISNGNNMSMGKPKNDILPLYYDTGNTFNNDNDNGTKVVRKLNFIKEFEERINCREPLDLDLLDYENDVTSKDNDNEMENNDNDNGTNNDWLLAEGEDCSDEKIIDPYASPSFLEKSQRNNEIVYRNDMVICENNHNEIANDGNNHNGTNNYNHNENNDSGFVDSSETSHVVTVISIYLNEIKTNYLIIYNFIIASVNSYRGELSNKEKRRLNKKSNRALGHLDDIIKNVKSIIARESSESGATLKGLLAQTAAKNNPKIWRYRQVLTKCLEQAEELKTALTILKTVVSDQINNYDNVESLLNNVPYYNIFE